MTKKILITGARQGMGRDSAFALARRGHTVFATTETAEQVTELEQEAQAQGVTIQVAHLDITNEDHYAQAVEFAPDVVVHNAGMGESGPIGSLPMNKLRANFETNVFGTVALTQALLPQMMKNKQGRFIIFSSVGGRFVLPYLTGYNMTKFALEAFADGFRQEVQHHGIDVSVIEPGAIATGFNERMNQSKYDWFTQDDLFGKDAERIKSFEKGLIADQDPTDSIVQAVVHASEASVPQARYVRPLKYAPLVLLGKITPARILDWVLAKVLMK